MKIKNKNNKVFTKTVKVEEFKVNCVVTRELVNDLKNMKSFYDDDMEKMMEEYLKAEIRKQKREERLKKINEIFND